jgi:hypothetical protein
MDLCYSEENFNKYLQLLNALSSEYSQWHYTTARKDHVDLFGGAIKHGEEYFKRGNGPAFSDVIKISQQSMDRLLYALFSWNPTAEGIGVEIQKIRMAKLREIAEHIRLPVRSKS